MTSVMPKVKLYFFLSIIVLLINLSVFGVSLLNASPSIESYTGTDPVGFTGDIPEDANATVRNFVLSSSSAFIPFFSIVSLLILDLPDELTVFTGIVLGVISAFQIFLLVVIALNMLPKVLGSGFDV